MQRLLVALLAAIDAAIAAAVGLVVLLAPLTVLWTLAFGVTAEWGALWPLTGTLWQFGHGVPLDVELSTELQRSVGLSPDASSFALSVTPLALLLFTLLFAARSGRRAARAGDWLTGVLAGSVVFGLIAAAVALTARMADARASLVLAILAPPLVYLIGAFCGAIAAVWEDGDGALLDRLHDVIDSWGGWSAVPASIVRGAAFSVVGVVAASSLAVAVVTALRAGDMAALFQATRADALGATMLTLGHLAYLPTLIVWAASWLAGPGFAVGVGTAVTPAGTQLGVVPGIPLFGLIPESSSFWMLIVVLLPIAAGAFAGWAVRSRLVWEGTPLGMAQRSVIAAGIGIVTAAVAAVAAALAGGSLGPGRLAEAGPAALPFALALGGEVLLGAAILLLSPRNRDELAEERTDRWVAEMTAARASDADSTGGWSPANPEAPGSMFETVPIDTGDLPTIDPPDQRAH